MNKDKISQVIIELVNKQLEPFNVTYYDVKHDPNWLTNYTTTKEDEESFIEWGTELIRKKLNMSKIKARKEMSWFILQYGLSVRNY